MEEDKKIIINTNNSPNGHRQYVSYYENGVEIDPKGSVELGLELLVSLDNLGYKFSNLKIISKRRGSDRDTLSKEIIDDLIKLKSNFIENGAALLD